MTYKPATPKQRAAYLRNAKKSPWRLGPSCETTKARGTYDRQKAGYVPPKGKA